MTTTLETAPATAATAATPRAMRLHFDGRVFLKVKLKSLAAEAKIIRAMERKHPIQREDLRAHRRVDVRNEARHTLLAYGFIRGRKLYDIQPKCSKHIDWTKVEAMVKRYGIVHGFLPGNRYDWRFREDYNKALLERFAEWKSCAQKK